MKTHDYPGHGSSYVRILILFCVRRNALSQAEHCGKQFGEAISHVLKTVGGATHFFGGKNESNVGGVAVIARVSTDAALGNGYPTETKFKCQ